MKWLLVLLMVGALSGCKSYKQNFQGRDIADIGFFADSTITMLGDLDMTLKREDTLLVRRFVNEAEAEEQNMNELDADLKDSLGNIVRYSIEIVNIAEMDAAETNKIQAYVNYLTTFRDGVQEMDAVDLETLDETIKEVMQQEEFIEALRKTQPLLNVAVMQAALKVEDLVAAVNVLATKLDGKIDEEYADIIRYRAKLEKEKFNIMTAFELIYDAYRTEEPNLDKLRERGVIWTPEIIPEGKPTREDLEKIGEHLHKRLEALQAVQTTIKPNWEDYIATHQELDAIADKTVASALRARILMLTWVRAHQKMSSGTTDPAKWFDIGEVTKSLIKTAPKAVL